MRRAVVSVLGWSAMVLLGGVGVTTARAEDWNQWRGPQRSGAHADEAIGGAKAGQLATLWKSDIGIGYAAPSVAGDGVFVMGYRSGQDIVRCLDAATGKERWSYAYKAQNFAMQNVGGTAATPSVVEGRVVTLSRDGQLHCLDQASGEVLWKQELTKTLGVRPPNFGFSGSPVVVGGRIYVDVGKIVSLSLETGDIIWQTKNFGARFSSPAIFEHGGRKFVASYPAPGLVVVDATDGTVAAQFAHQERFPNNHAATPLVSGDGKSIFVSCGNSLGGAMVAFDGKSLTEVWKSRSMRNEMATSVLSGDAIIGFDGGMLKAVDGRTGEQLWMQRGLGKGSLIQVGSDLVVLSDRGELVIAPASVEGFAPRVRQSALGGRGCWSAPVFSNGRLYLRDPNGALLCLDGKVTAGAAPAPSATPAPAAKPTKPTKRKGKLY